MTDLIRWPELKKIAGWAFKIGSSRAHFVWLHNGGFVAECRSTIEMISPYAADVDFPKCQRCVKKIKRISDKEFREYERFTGLIKWSRCEGSTKSHHFEFTGSRWRSACGVERSTRQLNDQPGDVHRCKKCIRYLDAKRRKES